MRRLEFAALYPHLDWPSHLNPNVAIRFIIASRPEHQICDMFNKEPLFSRTRRLVLDEAYDGG
jgi:hypothetical protein